MPGIRIAARFVLALLLWAASASVTMAEPGAWTERVMVLFDPDTRTVMRRTVRVWDPHPEKNLDFVWEPAPGTGVPEAEAFAIAGEGRLVWRVRGSAGYDPATIYSEYVGRLENGRPHGKGCLEIRTGESMDGEWVAGRLHGEGVRVDAAGNRYEGAFLDGLAHGRGVLRRATGVIHEGMFRHGRLHGQVSTTLAGGTRYESEWRDGVEVETARPDVLADDRIGGVLKAQSGEAGRTEFAVVVDQRMTQQSDMRYVHLVRDEDVAIYPESQQFNDAWNGTGTLSRYGSVFDYIDWENAPAFVEVGLSTVDGSRVRLEKLELQVAQSDAYLKPMLSVREHLGCVGFRPSFEFGNNGWGGVEEATITLQFVDNDSGARTRAFSGPIGSFDEGMDVYLTDLLRQAGVDVDALQRERFDCPSVESLGICRSQVLNNVEFGELRDVITPNIQDQTIMAVAEGRVDYGWTDSYGQRQQSQEAFTVGISLVVIEVPELMAECGAGFGGAPEALRYQDVALPVGQRNYTIDMPLRGNRNVAAYTARLKMHAEQSSIHRMQVAARFGDGSVRTSKPVTLFFLKPRASNFASGARPQQCYLSEDFGTC